MDWWWFLAGSGVTLVVWLIIDGRRQERAVQRDWDLILTPKGARTLEATRAQIDADLGLIHETYGAAGRAIGAGSREQALALLTVGCRLVEAHCPRMISALRALSVLSRMASAIAPMPPLRPDSLRLRELTGLAWLHAFGHHLLVSMHERFRWRILILQQCFGTLSRIVVATTRQARQTERPERAMPTLDAAQSDLRVLSDESLRTLQVWLVSLTADSSSK